MQKTYELIHNCSFASGDGVQVLLVAIFVKAHLQVSVQNSDLQRVPAGVFAGIAIDPHRWISPVLQQNLYYIGVPTFTCHGQWGHLDKGETECTVVVVRAYSSQMAS